ncbi:Elongin-C [Nakaseomyces bracarensis]|uniref:Elongin-C n=1 Tax=Nakaseomyces bracarensis TaxID=273131 RepID=A0ABR4NQK7_9SACH
MSKDTIFLISKDNVEHPVPKEAAMLSTTLKSMLEGPFIEKDGHINLPEMSSEVVQKIVEYLEYNLKYKDADPNKEDIPEFNVPTEMSLELLLAADYLGI